MSDTNGDTLAEGGVVLLRLYSGGRTGAALRGMGVGLEGVDVLVVTGRRGTLG